MLRKKHKVNFNPAVSIAIGFFVVILIGAFLLCLPISSINGQWFPFIDGLFTSTSAVCVTGLVVVDTAVHFSIFGQIILLLLIQIGGLGIITITTLVFMIIGKKISYQNRIVIQESFCTEGAGVLKFIKRIILTTLSIELAGFILLLPSMITSYGWGSGIFKSLFLSISAFCNAGFDILGTTQTEFASLAPFAQNVLVLLPIMFLIVLGGIGFLVMLDVCSYKKKDNKKLSTNSKIVLITTLVLIFGGGIIFAICEWNNPNTIGNMSFFNKISNSLFQSITPRTAGFATFNQNDLTSASKILCGFLMFIGGSPASTAGGIKTTTLFILLLMMFKNTNSKGNISYRNKTISNKVIQKAVKISLFAVSLIVISTFFICIAEGNAISVEDIMFEVISAISTVGLTVGITPLLGITSKIILVFLMYVGRIGMITLTVAVTSKIKQTNIDDIEYPDSKIIVG